MTTCPPLRNFFRIVLATAAITVAESIAKAAPEPAGILVSEGIGTADFPLIPLGKHLVAINDIIKNDTETIRFSGQASITAQSIDDVLTQAPRVLQLLIDFSQVAGFGTSSRKKYMTEAQCILHRLLIPFDSIQVSFPYHIRGDFSSARSVIATFFVKYRGAQGLEITSKLMPA